MKKLRNLDRNLLTSILTCIVSILGFATSSFLLLSSYRDIPLGFLFSGVIIGGLYLLTYFLGEVDRKNAKTSWSIAALGIRLFVIIGVMIILGFMNYRWNLNLFNLFVFVGVYTFGVLTFVLLHLLNKERKE